MKTKLTIALLLLATLTQAQEVTTLTLKEAINYALENKADAQKAKLDVENSDYKIQEVRSRALPQISANGSLTYNPILQTNVIDGAGFGAPGTIIQAAFGQKWNSVAGISLNQALYDQAVFIGLKAAKSTKEFYQLNAQLTEEQVIEKVSNAYYQVYVLRERLLVIANNLTNTSKVKDIIKGQFDNGLAKKIDFDRISVRVANINTQLIQSKNAVAIQENVLKFYIGMPMDTKIKLPKSEFEVTEQLFAQKPETTNRTEYQLLKKEEQLLQYQKKSIEALYYPTLSLSGSYNYIGQGPEMPWFKKPVDKVYWSDFASVGLNLHVPIFTGFGTRAKVRQAEIELKQNKLKIEDTQLALNLDFENAKKQMENSLETINIQKENAKLAQEVFNNTNNNYAQGLAPLTDLLDADNALVEAQNNYTASLLEYKLAEIQILKTKGELKTLTK